MILVTGATGQLGRLVIQQLLTRVPATQIIAAVRNPARAADLAALGLAVRQADYTQPASLDAALRGVEKVLLISANEVGQRLPQHKNVIDAAQRADVKRLVYTSLLHADTTPLALAEEHLATESHLQQSGLHHIILRNGWYTENYLASIPPALQHGAFIGAAGEGRIASAARADYAAAAVQALLALNQSSRIYELAGDTAYTLTEFAAELSRQTGKTIPYVNLSEAEFKAALLGAGLPEGLAELLANSDNGAAQGGLFDDQHQLSTLIDRPTTPLATLVQAALQ